MEFARGQLTRVTETPLLEAQLLAAFEFSQPREWVSAYTETMLAEGELLNLNKNLDLLLAGYPLAYITGEREFFRLRFLIKPGVLVPRPETELLVEEAIRWLKQHPKKQIAVDMGCGSGCIAVSLASECFTVSLFAVDRDPLAVRLTRENAIAHKVDDRVFCVTADLLSFTRMQVDLICANLPYIPSATLVNLPVTRYEPHLALDGGPDGLRLVEKLLSQSRNVLATDGLVLLEIESSQGKSAPLLARRYFPDSKIQLIHDLAGHPRLVSIQNCMDGN